MKLRSANIRNYRTLESVDLAFPSSYAAICGPNDSGKTNVVRALRALVRGKASGPFPFPDDDEFSRKDDYPKWKDTELSKQQMSFDVTVELDKIRDIGFYQFVVTQLKLVNPADALALQITVSHVGDKPEPSVVVSTGHATYSDLDAQQVLKKLQSSRSILFHTTRPRRRPRTSIHGEVWPGIFVRSPVSTSLSWNR